MKKWTKTDKTRHYIESIITRTPELRGEGKGQRVGRQTLIRDKNTY